MEPEKFVEMLVEIRPILEKYGAKNVVIGVDDEDGKFSGAYGAEREYGDALSMMKASLSCARLYQGAREKIFYGLERIVTGKQSTL